VAPSLHVVELKKAKGDTLEFQNVPVFEILSTDPSVVIIDSVAKTHIHCLQFYRTLSMELKDVVWVCDDQVKR